MIRNILMSIENENTLCKMVLFAILIPFSMKWWMIEAPVNVHIIFLPLASSKIVGVYTKRGILKCGSGEMMTLKNGKKEIQDRLPR